jgi:hypothetical protein
VSYELSPGGLRLILDHEVGGGRKYYERFLSKPSWPGERSGVTVGIGYDCGYRTRAQIAEDWGAVLPREAVAALQSVAGVKGLPARECAIALRGKANVPWEAALDVFLRVTVPRFSDLALGAMPGIEDAPQCVKDAVFSLVYNRGADMVGDRRREMRAVRDAVKAGRWADIPAYIRAMKRIWKGRGVDGLLRRRDAEAEHIEKGLHK